ncbi:MAG: hypothetical protein IJB36_06015 [Clostridia bacterium]|nr:hypothetical protein [Clostridia bacterium]
MKRKKWLSLLCVVALLLTVSVGCSNNSQKKEESTDKKADVTPSSTASNKDVVDQDGITNDTQLTLPKLEGEIKLADPFSEGLAFVMLPSHQKYFINKKGEIVIDLGSEGDLGICSFVNGFAVIGTDGTLCDKNGKIITPESVGVNELYGDALAGGYLLAQVMEANYSGTVFKLGVMDLNFKWVIEPTEANYDLLADDENRLPDLGALSYNRYYKEYLYIEDLNKFLYLKNFTLHDTWEYDNVPETWRWLNNKFMPLCAESGEQPCLDLNGVSNLEYCSEFVGEKAAVLFNNRDAKQAYFTIIDAEGEFAFEPVKVCDGSAVRIIYDGKHVAITGEQYIYILDDQGNALGQIKKTTNWSIPQFGDETILMNLSYYNLDGTPLF